MQSSGELYYPMPPAPIFTMWQNGYTVEYSGWDDKAGIIYYDDLALVVYYN